MLVWRDYLDTIALLPIDVDQHNSSADAMTELSDLSDKYSLSVYDAGYLELALRKKIPLATLDKKLKQAAVDAAVVVV